MARTGKPHARELHQVSDFGHVIVHRGKPHERESYSLQNTVAVTIMFVMHSSKEAL